MLTILSDLLTKFCEDEELKPESADEMLCNTELTDYQKNWLDHYIFLWDITQEEDQRRYEYNRTHDGTAIVWQAMNTGGGCMVYGADFIAAPSFCLSDECIVVINKGIDFVEYWTEDYNEGGHDAGCMWIGKDTLVVDYVGFLERHGLESYAQEIWKKFKEIGGCR